ncbi:MAG: hypothetical protein JJT75_08335 [Opitutales bacterium]|nr:hypothetical protein [Opitutales bacterium]MCH8540994.1 hypothetical protein [Opitutales bacterium]
MKNKILKSSLAALLIATPVSFVSGQTITHTAESGDITFFYAPGNEWEVVFRNKGDTVFTADPEVQANQTRSGSASGDLEFTSLTHVLNNAPIRTDDGMDFFLSPYAVSGLGADFRDVSDNPDIGIRTRLNNDDVEFTSFSLRLTGITAPAGGEILYLDGLSGDTLFDSRTDPLGTEFFSNVQGHFHYHFGFSELGEYTLDFEFDGVVDGTSTDTGELSVDFQVIPEPGTYAAIFGFLALAGVLVVRSRKSRKS